MGAGSTSQESEHQSMTTTMVNREPFIAGELIAVLNAIQQSHEALLQANEKSFGTTFPKLLCRYEAELVRLRQCISAVQLHGRDHLFREIRHSLDTYKSPKFQIICESWIGTPGVEETVNNIRVLWNTIEKRVIPSSEDMIRQLMQYTVPDYHIESGSSSLPKVVNFNVSNAGAGAQAHQKTTQDLQQELKLAQVLEVANSQETRFKALLKDLNSAAADLTMNIDQAQSAQQSIEDASQRTEQIMNQLHAQNECAQTIVNEIKRDRGLSRSLLTACAALALCIGIPKLTCLIPLAKKLPVLNKPAKAIERTLQEAESSTVLANLVRERHVYKSSYETLREVAEIEHNGNILHKLAFSFLGLGRILNRKLELLPPPSDVLNEDERWIEERSSPNGPTEWTRKSP